MNIRSFGGQFAKRNEESRCVTCPSHGVADEKQFGHKCEIFLHLLCFSLQGLSFLLGFSHSVDSHMISIVSKV